MLESGKWNDMKGLKTSADAKFYASSASFPAFSNKDKDLVVQFTVQHQQKIDCGGGYVKVPWAIFYCTDLLVIQRIFLAWSYFYPFDLEQLGNNDEAIDIR